MTQRYFSNTSSVGALTAPVAGSATTLSTSGLANLPTVPFTITVDRNTASEEICLVTAVIGASLTVTRGYDGTAQTTHAAGATVEHTAGAIEYNEASAHTNATTNVHGTTGSLVGTSGSQTVFGKTIVSPLLQASTSDGDAAVLFVPTGVTRNMLRGVDAGGVDRLIVDLSGNLTAQSLSSTAATTVHGALTVQGATSTAAVTATGVVALNGGATVPTGKKVTLTDAPSVNTDAVNKTYADALGVSAPTVSTIARRDSAGRLQVVSPAVAADVATKGYVDSQFTDTGWTTLSAAAGWSVRNGLRYRVKGGICYVSADLTRTGGDIAQGSAVTIFTLPSGARPTSFGWFITASTVGTTYGEVQFTAAGPVSMWGSISSGLVLTLSASFPID